MATAKITSQLQLKLAQPGLNFPLNEQDLILEFTHWRQYGPASNTWFGRTIGSEPPDKLMHTHFAPYDHAKLQTWLFYHEKKSYHKMGSTGYVLWANDPAHGDLLIDVIIEPDAHDLWTKAEKATLEGYLIVADNFCFNGTVP